MSRPQAKPWRLSVEQLERRENPDGSAGLTGAVAFSEGFNQVNPPQLPAGWANWSNNGEQQFLTTALTSAFTPRALASVGNARVQSRLWYESTFGADFGASVVVRIDTPTPVELIARGEQLNGSKASYISATIRYGGQVDLVEVREGVRTVLGTVRPKVPLFSGWVRITLRPSGEWAGVQVQRLDQSLYLTGQGTWQATEGDALRLKVTRPPAAGVLGVGRIPGFGGNAFLDDFAILAPPGVSESFDTAVRGTVPNGWQVWNSDTVGRVQVGDTRVLSPANALSSTGNSTTSARAWVSNAMPADVRATVSVYADSLVPAGVLVRGSALDTARPTYYSLTATRGLNIQLKRVVAGTETVIGSLKSTAYTSQVWVQLSLTIQGDQLQAIVYRPDTKQWLGSDGVWKTSPEAALVVSDGSISAGSLAGVERNRAASGAVWFDNFELRSASSIVVPTVTVQSSATGTVSGVVKLSASATPAASIARIEFVVNGQVRSSSNTATASWELDTTSIPNGAIAVLVRAIDSSGTVGSTTLNFDIRNAISAQALTRIDGVHKYSHIRIAQLAYSANPMGTFEQNLAANSVDLVVANTRFLNALQTAAPTTPTVIYSNISNLYDNLLTDWLAFADRAGVSRELAFYHVTQATNFTGSSPSSRPVNWLWNVSLASADGTGTVTDLTPNARGGRTTFVGFGATGQAITIGYPDRFRELNFTFNRPAAAGWQGIFEYVSAVDASGNPTAWKTLRLNSDGTAGFTVNGQMTFDPPADWVAAKNPTGTDRLFLMRIRTTAGTAAQAPEAATIFGRDYVNANGAQAGVIPAFDSTADRDGDGYLSDAEYSARRSGFDARFDYESRLFYPYYGQMRFITNPSSSAIRQWAANFHANLLASQPLADGLFIDNAHGRLPFSGTPVRESVASFTIDSAALVQAVAVRSMPKWVVTNTAGSRDEGNVIAKASTAAFEEFMLRPSDANWSTVRDVQALVNARLNSDSPSPYLIIDSHPGSKSTTDERTRTTTLAYYYLLGDPNKTFLMFFGGHKPSAPWSEVWVPAAAVDVGQPLNQMTVFVSGQDPENPNLQFQVYRRDYGNAMVLYKPRSYTLGKGTGTDSDATATTLNLGGSYQVLNADGTRGPTITQISLRNAEGVVLMKV